MLQHKVTHIHGKIVLFANALSFYIPNFYLLSIGSNTLIELFPY